MRSEAKLVSEKVRIRPAQRTASAASAMRMSRERRAHSSAVARPTMTIARKRP